MMESPKQGAPLPDKQQIQPIEEPRIISQRRSSGSSRAVGDKNIQKSRQSKSSSRKTSPARKDPPLITGRHVRLFSDNQMMQNLLLEEGGLVQVESVNLQVATYSKFQPQSPDFLDITNPKAVLENALRNFACLTTGDVIAINYNEKIYELRVMETKPDKAVSIIECDMNVDFDAPLGYKEPERHTQHEEPTDVEPDHSEYATDLGFRAFSGSGNRLDGKKKGIDSSPSPLKPGDIRRGIPNYEFKIGTITFIRNSRPQAKKVEEVSTDDSVNRFIAFSGEGQSLRKKGKKP
ncbi:unnamed protein product [Ranitomeya imitator]|uniref:Ubiquitin fusion degradation protein UFD1 N-terminal subdomain 2 domain-containing protein n=1 Tax=Ranitomeya imitator TaxID=111125 RepID=A0ABN9L406_9NEOB|nr:unnamed protein product [Ranitomeya imitator]